MIACVCEGGWQTAAFFFRVRNRGEATLRGDMRLYTKLLLMIVVFAGIQHFAPPSAWGGEAWFALRCHAANLLGDSALAEQLVDEYYTANHSVDRELQLKIEIECTLAIADADEAS